MQHGVVDSYNERLTMGELNEKSFQSVLDQSTCDQPELNWNRNQLQNHVAVSVQYFGKKKEQEPSEGKQRDSALKIVER